MITYLFIIRVMETEAQINKEPIGYQPMEKQRVVEIGNRMVICFSIARILQIAPSGVLSPAGAEPTQQQEGPFDTTAVMLFRRIAQIDDQRIVEHAAVPLGNSPEPGRHTRDLFDVEPPNTIARLNGRHALDRFSVTQTVNMF